MTDPIPARLAALKTMALPDLKAEWRTLFDAEPPGYNRRYLESRLAYRIQELAYGGLKPETRKRLEVLGEQFADRNITSRRIRQGSMPIAGTRLIREYQGVEHTVTVLDRRLRMAGTAVPVALGHRPRHHRHALERPPVLRPSQPPECSMSRGPEGKPIRKLRCAVYTRKSTEEGLDKEFNSLQAQREACEAYIASQRSEGWALVRDAYDDGGFSGGTLERPALQQLLADIEEGLVDVVVVYKIDRLSRSLMDFSKLVEVFDRAGVTFVSVTQSFNTTTSMGRLTLNILLSFAQFEREVIAERVRDKIRASRQKGMWMGGSVPLGYVVQNRKLVVHEPDAAVVRSMFERFLRVGSATVLAQELRAEGVLTTKGRPIDKGYLYKCLSNRTYLGLAIHKGTAYPGEHAAIIDQDLWDKVHAILAENCPHPIGQHPGADAGAAEGADLRADGRGDVADAYPQGQPALPLLRQPGRASAWARRLPDRAGAGGGDRGGRHRTAAWRVPAAGNHRRHVACGVGGAGRRHRGRGARGAVPARPAMGRVVSGRAGADRAAAGRAGGCAWRGRRHPVPHERHRRDRTG